MTLPSSNPRRPSGGWRTEDERPLPEPGFVRKVAEDLWEGFFALFVWTVALWILGIPVIWAAVSSVPLGLLLAVLTLAPGLAGLMTIAGNLARGGFARLGDAWRGTFRLYWRSVALTLPMAFWAALILLTANIVSAFPERRELFIAWAFQVGIGMVGVMLHVYLFPILVLHDAAPRPAVGLAFMLAGKCIWQTLALLALGGVLLAATTLHPAVWLFVPGVWCVIAANATWRMTRQLAPNPDGIDK
jgi:uncharacterized membrane protein YesL